MTRDADAIKRASELSFDRQARDYEFRFAGKHAQQLYTPVIEEISRVPHGSMLDVGCGPGHLLCAISKNGQARLSGIDISSEMIKAAREKLGESVDLRVGDSEHLPWDANSFDVVTCTDSFHHYPRPEKVLVEMTESLSQPGL